MTMREEIEAAAARYPNGGRRSCRAHDRAEGAWSSARAGARRRRRDPRRRTRLGYELATFYTLFHTEPIGRFHLQLCDNVSCMLCGSEALLKHLETTLGIRKGETTPDGAFTLSDRRMSRGLRNGSGDAGRRRLPRQPLIPRGSRRCWRASALLRRRQGVAMFEPVLLRNVDVPDGHLLSTYEAGGGYRRSGKRSANIRRTRSSTSSRNPPAGRGGAGFPDGHEVELRAESGRQAEISLL